MKIVFTSYIGVPEFSEPEAWLKRIDAYVGILEALGKHHKVISIERINFEGELIRKGVHYHFVRLRQSKNYLPLRMHQLIKKLQPDIVFVNGLIFPLQVIQLRMLLGNKVIIVAQNHAEKPSTGFRKWLQRMADKCIRLYFFTAHEMGMEWVEKRIISNEKKIVEVMEASSSFKTLNKEEALRVTRAKGSPVFLWVGRLDANKDPLTVVEAFLKFSELNDTAQLYMIFHTNELLGEIKTMICEAGCEETIKLIGSLPHKDLEAWYNSADYIISGSHYEGSGVAVCESMSCGCIPIVTNIASFRKMTGNGEYGFLYEAGNSDSLLQLLINTKNIDITRKREKVLEHFKNELSFEAIARKIEETLQSI